MSKGSLTTGRVSTAPWSIAGPAGVNSICHGFAGGVTAQHKHVLFTPEIILVLWDTVFVNNAAAVSTAQQLLTDLVTGKFMNGLTQYGVVRGTLINTVVVNTVGANGVPAPATWDNGGVDDKNQIERWLNDGTVQPTPGQNETSRLYVIILPNSTKLTDGSNSPGGWHKHAMYGSGSRFDNLFWAVVGTFGLTLVKGSEAQYINSFAPLVGHELCEACSDRDEDGYMSSNQCEIGDLCEQNAAGTFQLFPYPGTTAPAQTWTIEQYWSQWDNSCIRGDKPVSLRNFLTAINYTTASTGLRGVGSPVLSLDYIAGRMR